VTQRLDDVVVLVTGGTRGIGRALAEGLADAGAFVELVARDKDELAQAVEAIGPARCAATAADLGTEEGLAAVVAAVGTRHERLHGLINNAATSRLTPLEGGDHRMASWDRVLRLNVTVPFLLTVELLPLLVAGAPSRVINIGSIDGLRVPEHDAFAYAASKAGLHHLTEMLAAKLGARGVRVNAIAPSLFQTRMSAERLDGKLPHMAALNPLGRVGAADDVVGLVSFLLGPHSDFVNGAVIPLDGGVRTRTVPFGAMSQLLDEEQFEKVVHLR
jgi:NAD(P)-dependent dehydrogenase (short-subunit alcohol dehydrogenase family)